MRKILRRFISILDGTPAIYGKRQAGQSMVELAMVTPLLIILLAGLVEIGWFANNYLSLLDVTRFGARRATVLIDQQAPNAADWLPEFSYVPTSRFTGAEAAYAMPALTAGAADTDVNRGLYRYDPAIPTTGACNPNFVARLFYNEIICTMTISLEPLFLDPDNGIDDIIISGFSLEMVDLRIRSEWLSASRYDPDPVPQMAVAGRWPTTANECDVTGSGPVYAVSPREPRDPFDMNDNGAFDDGTDLEFPGASDGTNDYAELAGYDATAGTAAAAERQVGFSLFGQRKIPNSLCVGSSWTIAEVERLFNLPNYVIADAEARSNLPGQGLVLVEMFWEHTMLLQIPVLSPVFTAVGNADGKMVISVWAAFPLPAVEPYIVFPES